MPVQWQAARGFASAKGAKTLVARMGNGHAVGMIDDNILARYRSSIDNIDAALVFMLAERFKITQAVGQHKASAKLPAADPAREERQIARLRQLAEDAQLDPNFTEQFLRFIITEVIRHHERVKDS